MNRRLKVLVIDDDDDDDEGDSSGVFAGDYRRKSGLMGAKQG